MCAIYLYCDFLHYASRELNVIDSDTVTLAMTILVKKLTSYPGLPALGCFIQTWYHMMYIPVDNLPPSTTACATRKQQDCTLKSKLHQNTL